MKYTLVRIGTSAIVFVLFAWLSTIFYMKNIHDVGGTYWSMGVFGLPAVLLIVWCADTYLKKLSLFQNRYIALAAVDGILSILFYWPGLVIVWGIIYVFSIA